jgi:hypothetical protein
VAQIYAEKRLFLKAAEINYQIGDLANSINYYVVEEKYRAQKIKDAGLEQEIECKYMDHLTEFLDLLAKKAPLNTKDTQIFNHMFNKLLLTKNKEIFEERAGELNEVAQEDNEENEKEEMDDNEKKGEEQISDINSFISGQDSFKEITFEDNEEKAYSLDSFEMVKSNLDEAERLSESFANIGISHQSKTMSFASFEKIQISEQNLENENLSDFEQMSQEEEEEEEVYQATLQEEMMLTQILKYGTSMASTWDIRQNFYTAKQETQEMYSSNPRIIEEEIEPSLFK